MARLKPNACFRNLKRPYTRVSRYREVSYVKGVPESKVRKFDMGNVNGNYDCVIQATTKEAMQIRHNSLEAFRMSALKNLEKALGKDNFYLKINVYPHQIMRHKPTSNFAGADRFSSGMKHCYGKPVGRAAIVKQGQVISTIKFSEKDITKVKNAIRISRQRLPCIISLDFKRLNKTL